jgi:hypothetical protein
MRCGATKRTGAGFSQIAGAARRLTKGALKADLRMDDLIRFDGGYGQQRRTRKWAAFAFVEKPKTLKASFSGVIVRQRVRPSAGPMINSGGRPSSHRRFKLETGLCDYWMLRLRGA